jgi:hypothetical protein
MTPRRSVFDRTGRSQDGRLPARFAAGPVISRFSNTTMLSQ